MSTITNNNLKDQIIDNLIELGYTEGSEEFEAQYKDTLKALGLD